MERKELVAKAKELELEFPGNISTEKLENLVEEAEIAVKASGYEVAKPKPIDSPVEVTGAVLRKNGLLMKHVIITPLSDTSRTLASDMHTVMTPKLGTIKKVVQYGKPSLEPVAILTMLEEKSTLIQQKTTLNGVELVRKVAAPAFNIKYLPDLTLEEFEDLKNK